MSTLHGEFISKEEADTLTGNYVSTAPTGATESVLFSKSLVTDLLAQSGTHGLRVSFARDSSGILTVVLYAADEGGAPITEVSSSKALGEQEPTPVALILEHGVRCPPFCPTE